MSTELATAYISLVPSLKGVQGAIASELGGVGGAGGTGGKALGGGIVSGFKGAIAPLAGLGAAAFGVSSIIDWGRASIDSLSRIETINAQTASAIDATGGSAGVTAGHVEDLANSLEGMTSTEAESIQSGANLLLTFKNIKNGVGAGNDVFDQATGSLVDMARAMGTDPQNAAIQLGKALNDPVAGISALSRVGVTFSEDQKKVIQSLVDTGDVAGAQKIILGELNSEFGGAGAAYADTFAGKADAVANAWGNVGEQLFSALMPVLSDLADMILNNVVPAITSMISWMQDNPALIQTIAAVIGVVAAAVAAWTISQWALNVALLANPIGLVIAGIVALIAGVVALAMNWDAVVAWISGVWGGFVGWLTDGLNGIAAWWNGVWQGILTWIGTVWTGIVTTITTAWTGFVAWITAALVAYVGFWQGVWNGVWSFITGIWNGMVSTVSGIWSGFIGWITGVITGWVGFWMGIWQQVGAFLNSVWQGMVSTVTGLWQGFLSWITGAINGWVGFWNGVWTGVASFLSGIWGGIVTSVTTSWNGVMDFLSGIPDRIMGFFDGIGGWLVDSGTALIQGFIDGISGMIGAVGDAVGGVLDFAAGFFPHSPAKRGPFGPTGWAGLQRSGGAILNQFMSGMQSGDFGALNHSLEGVLGALPADIRPIAADIINRARGVVAPAAAAPLGAGTSGTVVNFNGNVGWDPDEVASSIRREQRYAAIEYGLGDVLA